MKDVLGEIVWSAPEAAERSEADTIEDCVPWDKTAFAARCKTFVSSRWFAKPEAISPLQCARFGWVNTGVDQIGCPSCHKTIFCTISPLLAIDSAEKVGQKFYEQLTTSHTSICPWKDISCPESFVKLPDPLSAVGRDSLLGSFHTAINSFSGFVTSISSLNVDLGFRGEVIHFLAKLSPDVKPENIDQFVTFMLAICGWTLKVPSDSTSASPLPSSPPPPPPPPPCLQCSYCFRDVFLSDFQLPLTADAEEPEQVADRKRKASCFSLESPAPKKACAGGNSADAKQIDPNEEVKKENTPKAGPDSSAAASLSSPTSASSGNNISPSGSLFHPAEAHRYYCPFVTSRPPDKRVGWQVMSTVVVQRLFNKQGDTQFKMAKTLSYLRHLFLMAE
mmetsp:Transcript_29253/g.57453  ORF Transcript_29253/g.57453 Transcript_29253/m.57453 type:complete len:392 (-) Transcript_29253:254-1429(-)|eukprot:CAMPEP_0175120254 /NCGR_PEP_ID=MMETSP0087-20121206/518_1 /TAXON_ID=136419 /ORGANISM="Unknown Unknown, Strain D1" /LENGTH=391 /DNA_ID=CAMNT_0016401679 /DNA_START=19 /DNA_END=1194 /DNA_ORIENTATION=+